jgi:hypothetical protein
MRQDQEQLLEAQLCSPDSASTRLVQSLMQTKKPPLGNKNNKVIFSNASQLGLSESPAFQKFFISLSEESQNIRFARLSRQAFKEFLQRRYTPHVGEKIMLFLENQFLSLYRIDIHGFCNIMKDFLNAGPDCHKKLIFSCLSRQNQGRICEHDLFNLIEHFKQRESFFFYREIIQMRYLPRDFSQLIDFSDKVFFDAYANDLKLIATALRLRQQLTDTVDPESQVGLDEDDTQRKSARREEKE